MTVEIRTVRDAAAYGDFIAAARRGQATNPHWVEPVRTYYDALLDRAHSPIMAENEVELFVAYRDGEPVGRVAAIKNAAHLAKYADLTGQFGLIEAIDDAAVFEALLSAAADFLRSRGLRRMTGPFSLTINHETGLLVEGFDEPHVAHTNHAPPFYAVRLEAAGLRPLMDVEAWAVPVRASDFPARVARMAARVPEAREIRTVGTTPLTWAKRTALLNTLFNDIWSRNWGSIPVSAAEGRKIALTTLPTSKLSWLRTAEYKGEPIALMTQIPDMNEGLRGLGGRLFPFGWTNLLSRMHVSGTRTTRMPMFGLKREWHRTRVGTLAANMLMAEAITQAKAYGAEEMEISWILKTNTVFLNMVRDLPARLTRTFRIYERDL